jgi:hypothetical protein
MREAATTSETSVHFYQTSQRYNPQDSQLHTVGNLTLYRARLDVACTHKKVAGRPP